MPADLATNLRLMRRQRAMTLDELAATTGLTKSYLSKIERGLSVPSIATALKLARAFGVQVGQLFGDSGAELVCVVRKDERQPFQRPGSRAGYQYAAIAAGRAVKIMEPFIMNPPAKLTPEDIMSEHDGEEFIFVLKGRVEVVFPNRRVELGAGDSIYFDSRLPHRCRSMGSTLAEALVIVACDSNATPVGRGRKPVGPAVRRPADRNNPGTSAMAARRS